VLSKIKRFTIAWRDIVILRLPEKQFFNALTKLQQAALTAVSITELYGLTGPGHSPPDPL
jgi:hypothetical protein